MNEIRRYETRGSAAMACREYEFENRALIDYEIARRSYEARMRLAQRQASSQRSMARDVADVHVNPMPRKRSMRLQDAVASSYTPDQPISSSLSNMWEQVVNSVVDHPFWNQLKHGSTAGSETGKITYKQAFTSATVCMALSAVMIFVGA